MSITEAETRFAEAVELGLRGEYDAALEVYRALADEWPVPSAIGEGSLHYRVGQYDAALGCFDRAVTKIIRRIPANLHIGTVGVAPYRRHVGQESSQPHFLSTVVFRGIIRHRDRVPPAIEGDLEPITFRIELVSRLNLGQRSVRVDKIQLQQFPDAGNPRSLPPPPSVPVSSTI